MSNSKNLKPPINQRSTSEAREISKKGGINSGIARKKKKILKEEFLTLLDVKVLNENGKKETLQKKICYAIILKAMNGDVRAAEFIRDTIGEKPTQDVNLNRGIEVQKIFITPEMQEETDKIIDDYING